MDAAVGSTYANSTAPPRRWERRLVDPRVTARREEFNRKQGSPRGASMENADANANSAGSSMNNVDANAKSAAPERWSNTKRAKTAANSEEPRNMNNDETAEKSNAPPTSKCENHSPAAQVVQVLQTYVSALRTFRGRDGKTVQLLALGNDLTGLFFQLPSDMNGDADEDDGSEDDSEEEDDEGDEVADEVEEGDEEIDDEEDDEEDDTPTTFAVGDRVFGYSPDGAEVAGWYGATVVAAVPGPRGVAPEQGERYGILYDHGESGADMRLCDVGHPDNFTVEDDEEEDDEGGDAVDDKEDDEEDDEEEDEEEEGDEEVDDEEDEEAARHAQTRAKTKAKKAAQKARCRGRSGALARGDPGSNATPNSLLSSLGLD